MRNIFNPNWLFIVNTLPLFILLSLFYSQFNIISSLLDEQSTQLWKTFGFALLILAILTFVYAIYLTVRKRTVPIWFAFLSLILYISYLYLYGYHAEDLIPFSIPQWMISGNIFLHVGTFFMPTLIYSLFLLVTYFTPENKEYKAWVNFLIAIAIPISAYIFVQVIVPLWKPFPSNFSIHVVLVLIISATLVFLFFLIRSVYILARKKSTAWKKYEMVWKIPFAIVLPLIGLLVNNGVITDTFRIEDSGVFGDFTDKWFYILAVVNGLFLCLPSRTNKTYRLVLYIARTVTFAYTLYFFLVFLPFLPLSVIAIIAVGTGFLMLTPLVLFVIHSYELSRDALYLQSYYSKRKLFGISVLSFLLIPICITASYIHDKDVLHQSLAYVYSPNYSKEYTIDTKSLQKTLSLIKRHKDNRNNIDSFFGTGTPYLSSYFNWIVLDNLTLPDSKINTIQKIFFKTITSNPPQFDQIQNKNVHITNIATSSTYDKSQNAWKSWVDLEITNKGIDSWMAEYATTIDLPEGCWISDYYLYVGDTKEPGILAEKKSALWIFSQIRNENRDPGILYYLTGNRVAFRIFPFAEHEVRRTGIEFLHKEPIKLHFDGHLVSLGNLEETIQENIEDEHIAYVSSHHKKTLQSVKRTPYFHFLVDVSKNQSDHSSDFIKRINQVMSQYESLSEGAQISFVNSYTHTIPLDENWEIKYKNQHFEGGFFLDRAIRKSLVSSYQNKSARYPVIVVVTDSIEHAVLNKDFADLEFTFPESNLFYFLDSTSNLKEHSLIENPAAELQGVEHDCKFCESVLEYKLSNNSVAYLPQNDEASLILKQDVFSISKSQIKEKNWHSSLIMQGLWNAQILNPEISDEEWINLVKFSFISKIMSPVTSYIVVENEAQKNMLKRKQEQILSGNKDLEPGEEVQRMSEPSMLLLIAVLGLLVLYRKKKWNWI